MRRRRKKTANVAITSQIEEKRREEKGREETKR